MLTLITIIIETPGAKHRVLDITIRRKPIRIDHIRRAHRPLRTGCARCPGGPRRPCWARVTFLTGYDKEDGDQQKKCSTYHSFLFFR